MESQRSRSLPSLMWLCLVVSLLHFPTPCRSDPDPLQDFCVADLQSKHLFVNGFPCKAVADVTPDDFFFTGLAKEGNTSNPVGAITTRATALEFPGLNTIGLSIQRGDFAEGGVSVPHTHPRASEIVLVIKGRVMIGFITSGSNQLYSKVMKKGEVFAVPRGVMHFTQNVGKGKAVTIAVFDSQNPGGVFAPATLFGSKPAIPTQLLAKAFQMNEKVVDSVKYKFGN